MVETVALVPVAKDCLHLMALMERVYFVNFATSVLHWLKTLAAASHLLAHKNSFLDLSYMSSLQNYKSSP